MYKNCCLCRVRTCTMGFKFPDATITSTDNKTGTKSENRTLSMRGFGDLLLP